METQKIRYYEFGKFKLDAKRRILFKSGEEISLTGRIFDLLLVLLQNNGQILDHEELLEKVWGETFVEQANLKKGISSLRQILGEKPNESLYVKTIPRRGYSFVAEVTTAFDDSGFFNVSEFAPKAETVEKPEEIALADDKSEETEAVQTRNRSASFRRKNFKNFFSTKQTPDSRRFVFDFNCGNLFRF